MFADLRPALVLFVLLSMLTGLVYPLAVTLVAQAAFPAEANGSPLYRDGTLVGSGLLGQAFTGAGYFHGRPSVTDPPYGGAAGGGSNLAVTSATLRADVAARIAALRALDPGNPAPVPIDLVTASGSGLDPHISPAAATWQAGRVAAARGLDPAEVMGLVAAHTADRTLGILGEPRVIVVTLNLALDALDRISPRP
jgi:K+-transporting ATPase ATPase C chain